MDINVPNQVYITWPTSDGLQKFNASQLQVQTSLSPSLKLRGIHPDMPPGTKRNRNVLLTRHKPFANSSARPQDETASTELDVPRIVPSVFMAFTSTVELHVPV